MSSVGSVLQNARPERPGEFTFTWSIHNYSYFTMKRNYCFRSPVFEVEFLEDAKWCLQLYPAGTSFPGFVSFGLINKRGCYMGSFNFTLLIRKSNGQFDEGKEDIFNSLTSYEHSKFISCVELMHSNRYLVNDTLTLCCRMWKTDLDIPASVQWEAHSRIKVSKLYYTWIINGIWVTDQKFLTDFIKTVDVTEFFTEVPNINLQVIEKGLCGSAIQFGIEMKQPKMTYFWKAVVHLIDANGKAAHSARGEHLFESSDQTLDWTFALISKEELYRNKLLYMPKNQLTLRCELRFATDNKLETFKFQIKNGFYSEPTLFEKESDLHRVWHKNLQQCYENRNFTDFIIRTPASQFPVSRNILSAHSEVFGAMFERDMKEGKTGVVDIDDLEDDTISKMLMYVYTSTFDANDCSTARKLYYAADKYGITALQKMCSKFLMDGLDVSNICDILELSDTHQDEELKSCARDVFRIHAKKIINSESWKKLRETNPFLTSETVEWMISVS